MNPREQGFLLLTSKLGDAERKNLTVAQLRTLATRVRSANRQDTDREMVPADLAALGYSAEMADRILELLSQRELLEYYLHKGRKNGCEPLTRASDGYPQVLRKRLGADTPGCLWAKGDLSLLQKRCVALVGSRDLRAQNRRFAAAVGYQAAKQGYALVSGNARGADRTAQEACLAAGGQVICVVADELDAKIPRENVLFLSEDSFDLPFSAQRALSRNRVIHSLGTATFVAQSGLECGGTWDGTVRNLRCGWSDVFCFRDQSPASVQLEQLGAVLIDPEQLEDLSQLEGKFINMFDQ